MLRVLVFALAVSALSALFHSMVYQWAMDALPSVRPHKRKLIAVLAVLVVLAPAARFVAHRFRGGWTSAPYAAAMIEVLVVMVAAPLLILTRFAGRLRERRAKASGAAEPEALSRRQALERMGGAVALGATGSAFGWGAVRGRHAFEMEEIAPKIVGLPKVLDGYTIVQISDIHVGAFVQERELDEGLELVRRVKPDLIVVTGDMIDFDPAFLPIWARALQSLTARDGIVTILGNHDYYTGATKIQEAVEGIGASVMVNRGTVIRAADGGGFALLGVDDAWGGSAGGPGPSLATALRMVPRDLPRILLSHQPKTVELWAGQVALQLSGHTHGGQVNAPGGGLRPADAVFRYVSGRYDVDGTTLWVNRGFGVAGPPTRVGAPPEVTKIVLVSG